jgi:hypothetical protein
MKKDYYIYYGNKNATTNPKADPHNIYFLFENWEKFQRNDTYTTIIIALKYRKKI